jgi:hypothetical protein
MPLGAWAISNQMPHGILSHHDEIKKTKIKIVSVVGWFFLPLLSCLYVEGIHSLIFILFLIM